VDKRCYEKKELFTFFDEWNYKGLFYSDYSKDLSFGYFLAVNNGYSIIETPIH
jgi:hypothetical protein